jgi:hypothetical protein
MTAQPKTAQPKTITPQSAHDALIRKLTALTPPRITGKADADAVKARVEYLRAVHRAVGELDKAVVIDTTDRLPARIDYRAADEVLFDAISDSDDPDYDVIAALARVGCRLERFPHSAAA